MRYLVLAILILSIPSAVAAIPHVYWNPVTGNDANSGMNKPSAVQTLARCRELLNLSDTDNDTGFKWDDADTSVLLLPENADILGLTMRRAKDKTEQRNKAEVIPGHGLLSDEDVDDSNNAGFRIRYKHVWEIFYNLAGAQERRIRVDTNVEMR